MNVRSPSVLVWFLISLILFMALPGCLGSATPSAPAGGSAGDGAAVTSGKYLLTFHVRDISVGIDPSKNTNCTVYLAASDDGAAWAPVSGFTPFKGSAPDIVTRAGTVYFYAPDPDLVTRYNLSTGALTRGVPVVIHQADGTNDDYGDVSPILDPATNKIVLFYKTTKGFSGDPQLATLPICSATEVDGSDGTSFQKDDGERLGPAQHADSAIFSDGSAYFLYVGYNLLKPGETAKVVVYTSATLRGTYTPVSTLAGGILVEGGSVPSGYIDAAAGTIKPAAGGFFYRALTRRFLNAVRLFPRSPQRRRRPPTTTPRPPRRPGWPRPGTLRPPVS